MRYAYLSYNEERYRTSRGARGEEPVDFYRKEFHNWPK